MSDKETPPVPPRGGGDAQGGARPLLNEAEETKRSGYPPKGRMERSIVFDAVSAGLLAMTYFHSVKAFRPLPEGGEEAVCRGEPCALSRSAMVSAPTPPDRSYVLPEALYRLSLYTRPELAFRLGDRAEVRDEAGRVFRGRTSDSFRYPSHCVTVLEVAEVEGPDETHVSQEEE